MGCCSWGRTESDTTEAAAAAKQESSSHSLRVSWLVRGRAMIKIQALGDFPGGAVDKTPPTNAGDVGSISGPGRFHLLWSKPMGHTHIPRACAL